jgi:hypothetical protein
MLKCDHCAQRFVLTVVIGPVADPTVCARCWRERTTVVLPAKTELRFHLYAQPRGSTGLVKIGRCDHHASGGYSLEFDKPALADMQRWILASAHECSTWADFGLSALPDTLDDIHVWADSVLVMSGSRLPSGYCEGVAEKMILFPRAGATTLPARATAFHSLASVTPCPIEGCRLMACPGRPLCVSHWATLPEPEREAVWRTPEGPARDARLREAVEKAKLGTCRPADAPPPVPPPVPETPVAASRVRRPRLA